MALLKNLTYRHVKDFYILSGFPCWIDFMLDILDKNWQYIGTTTQRKMVPVVGIPNDADNGRRNWLTTLIIHFLLHILKREKMSKGLNSLRLYKSIQVSTLNFSTLACFKWAMCSVNLASVSLTNIFLVAILTNNFVNAWIFRII